MEQFNDQSPGREEEDHDILLEDEPGPAAIFQIRNFSQDFPEIPSVLTDSQVLLGYQVDVDSSSIDNKSDPISQMLRNLEQSVINEKDAEISVLKSELEEKNKEIVEFKKKLTKLVDFISFVHGKFGKLLRNMMMMEIQDGSQVKTNILRLGPFKNETAKAGFIQNLNDLSTNLGHYKNLTGTRVLFDNISMILSSNSKENGTNMQSANNISHINTSQVHSIELFNGGIKYATEFSQAMPLPPPTNMATPPLPLPPSSCFQDMPPPVSSTQNTPPPANVTEYTDYPVLSIQEAPLPNFMAPKPQQLSSSNMTMEPPPSPITLTMRRPPPSISRNSLQTDYGINLATANKKHGIDHSKGHWGFFCLCNTRFSSSDKLKDHIQYFTMKNLECPMCKKRYHKPGMLKKHMISSHKLECLDNGMLTCSICQENFTNSKEFREHLQNMHGIQTSLKENNFANGSRKHARVFSTDIPYGCICGKIYTDRRGLIIHINTNLYGNVFKCCWCTRKFLTHYMLKCHVRRIHGVELDKQNKYGCAVCGKTFNFLAELRKHRGDVHRIVRESASDMKSLIHWKIDTRNFFKLKFKLTGIML